LLAMLVPPQDLVDPTIVDVSALASS